MGTDPARNEDTPAIQDVLDALDDPDCQEILKQTTHPMTAKELTDTCEIPISTMYRKLDLLSSATLVRELPDVHSKRGRITHYQRDFVDIEVSITDDNQFDVTITRPERTADERLAEIWSEMGDEL